MLSLPHGGSATGRDAARSDRCAERGYWFEEVPAMRERAEAMVLASFVADSHALGAHWIYDIDEIATRYGRVERLLPPPPDSFHAGRAKGSFTHYGDQTLLLLQHLASHRDFVLQEFADEWRAFVEQYDGYRDKAMQATLANLIGGAGPTEAGSDSKELSAAGRIAPLVYLFRDDRAAIIRTAREQCSLTHKSATAVESTEFLAGVLWRVLNGKTPTAAIRTVIDDAPDSPVTALIRSGLESTSLTTTEAARRFGQGCGTTSALPLAIHLIATYEGSLRNALVENVAAGGDSAARGMVVGMVLGAFHGRDAIPDEWIEEMRAYREISTLLEDLEAIHQRNGVTNGDTNVY